MNKKILVFGLIFSLVFLGVCLSGCRKDKPADTTEPPEKAAPDTPESPDTPDTSGEKPKEPETPKDALKGLESKDPELAKMLAKMFEEAEKKTQKTCPVMGKAIKRDIFVEYKGKKVYFCCPDCKDTFNADPEKYLSKLPQFQE